jgi:surfactin family lipopeptide synthetase A
VTSAQSVFRKDFKMDRSEAFSTPDVAPLSEAKRKLLEKYLREGGAAATRESVITRRPSAEPAPLSLSQEQLWLRERGTHGIAPLYNECVVLRMSGPLDVPVLERGFVEIIRRHEIWRTSYVTSNGQPVQFVHPASDEFRLQLLDLRSLPTSARREAEAQRVIGDMVRQPFDLKEGPLLRARLVRMDDSEHRLFLCAHLSIVDGVSVYQVFPSELATLYSAYAFGRPSPLPPLTVQFGDYAYWQRQWLQGREMAKQVAYWRKQLAGQLPALNWPTGRTRPARETFRGTIRSFTFPRYLGEAVKALGKQEGVTLFMTLLAAFVALLHRYTEQEDIVVGTPSPAGRKRSEVQKLLGYFLNPVALRFDLAGNPSFRELLRRTQRATLEAISNDDVPMETLAQELKLKPDAGRNPFFTVAISLQPPMPQLDLEWSVTSMDIESGGAPWDLYVAFIERTEGIMGRVQYNTDLFDPETITRMLEHLQRLLKNVSANPTQPLSEVKFLSSRDRLPSSNGAEGRLRNFA